MPRKKKDAQTIPGMGPVAAVAKPQASQGVAAAPPKAADPPTPAAKPTPAAAPTPAPAPAPAVAQVPASPKAEAAPKAQAKAKGGQPAPAASQSVAAPKAGQAVAAPKGGASAKGKAKAAPAPAPEPVPDPEPEDPDAGMETIKKKKRGRKKAEEMTAHEAQAIDDAEDIASTNPSAEEFKMSSDLQHKHKKHFNDLSGTIFKDIHQLPEFGADTPPQQVLREVQEQRTMLQGIVQRVEDILKEAKCPRPKIIDAKKILDQYKELRQCQTDTEFTEEMRLGMLEDKSQELSKAHRWEAFLKFQEELNQLRERCTKRMASNDVMAKEVRAGNDKRRIATRVASAKGVKVDELDESTVVSTTVELPPEVIVLSFLYKSKFE